MNALKNYNREKEDISQIWSIPEKSRDQRSQKEREINQKALE
jgi:hypothetical protein